MTSLRKGQERYQWRLAEVRCLLVENYSNSRQVWSSRSFLQFLGGLRPNDLIVFLLRHVLFICSVIITKVCRHICLSTVLTQDHFYSDWCIYKLQRSPLLFLRWCLSACELLGSCRLASTWWQEKANSSTEQLVANWICMVFSIVVFDLFYRNPRWCKVTWLVLGGDPAARSHRVEQFTALWGL